MQIKVKNVLDGLKMADFIETRCLKVPPKAMVSLFAMILYFYSSEKSKLKEVKLEF